MPNPTKNKKHSIVSQKDLNLILRILKNNWWVPILILPVFYGIGRFYAYRKTNVYKASTEFLLKTNDVYYQNNVLSEANFYSYNSYVDNLNEKRIIQSYDLANEVVNKLIDRIQVSYFLVGKVNTTEDFEGMPFKIIVNEKLINEINPGIYEQRFDFRILDTTNFEISYENDGGRVVRNGKFNTDLPHTDIPIRVEKAFARKDEDKVKSAFYQFTIHTRNYLISQLQNNLRIENPEYTNILRVELTDVVPDRAVLILDTLNSVYAMSKLQTKFDLNERTINYIDRQLSEITFSLKSIEDTMQDYKNKRSIINLSWEESDFLTKIGAYDNQKSKLQLDLEALNDLEKYIIEDKDPQFLPPNVFISEQYGFMRTAVNELYTKQIELNKLFSTAKDMNPMILELKSTIKKTKQDLLIYINNSRKATTQQISNINKEIYDYINQAKLIPGKQRDILNIQRKAAVSEQLYNFLLEKKASTKIAKASIIPDVKIVESPRNIGTTTPEEAAKTQKQFILLGVLIALTVIIIRSLLFTKIQSVEHLKELTSLPVIGVLPYIKKTPNEGIVVEQNPNSMISEAFRNFRTNLQYSNVDINAKTFLITSFLPGEGKTFTSVNLASILARSGKKTVLLELDLHKPRIYKRFGLPVQQKGITTYISGLNNIDEIISETVVPNLYCMFAGPVPPNPSEFVLSEKMKELIRYAKENFDYVIIDTPPAGLLSDSVYLMQNVDSSIFVLNTRSSTKRVVTFVEELIESNNFKNISLLLNGVKSIGRKYYYQGYGYSYGYGYGYGYGKGHGYRK